MYVKKSFSLKDIFAFAGHHIWWLATYMFIVAALFQFADWQWLAIPWLPVSLVGTALAFYIGFKNNQSYDRVWESRKIWGAIVNSSRSWGMLIDSFIRPSEFSTASQSEINAVKKRLICRHIAWLYTLREQLLQPTQWEHASLRWHYGRVGRKRREREGVGMYKDFLDEAQKERYFTDVAALEGVANKATQLINLQSRELAKLVDSGLLHMRRQLDMEKILQDFYDHQGKAERIKKFPLPRQYANHSFIFNCIFIFILPMGMVGEFAKLGPASIWLMIPFGTLVGWVYVVMELIGDYSENPFEGLSTDTPMLSICRTIEIDLLQMLNEEDIPKPIQPIKDILL